MASPFSLSPFLPISVPPFLLFSAERHEGGEAKRPCRRQSAGAFSFAGGGAVAMTVYCEHRGSGAPVAANASYVRLNSRRRRTARGGRSWCI